MIKVENIEVFNFEGAIRGMRNPLNSWEKSDSHICYGGDRFDGCTGEHPFCPRKDDKDFENDVFCVGKADLDLMHRLFVAGSEHRKFLRQLFVSMDITAPLYWIAECDTYKVGTTRNSCSLQHTGSKRDYTIDDFSFDEGLSGKDIAEIVDMINKYRRKYIETKDYKYFRFMRQVMPQSYNYKSTVTMSYENVVNMIKQRENHKLQEWKDFTDILKDLPYVREIMEV
jgi:hypothetical protein